MPSRRTPSMGSISNSPLQRHRPAASDTFQTQTPNSDASGMTAASRYNSNLKVLRRRDPSIISIFDQFSHVCVYHYNGQSWEKQGYEGSMFLYERNSYPPYGFYILNRMGMDDYIQRLYPEDNIHEYNNYIMVRTYPDFTTQRLANAGPITDKFSDTFKVDENLSNDQKGRSNTISLWVYNKGPMVERMFRLHTYIKQNLPYPDEFKYGPDKPPPENQHLRTPSLANAQPTTQKPEARPSQLDHLFSKLKPPEEAASSNISVQALLASAAASSQPEQRSTSNMTVESLFAALTGEDVSHTAPASATTPSRPALLDSIFASVTAPPQQQAIPILSPMPTTSALPQILTQDVLSTLMGLPPSRTTSSASIRTAAGSHKTGSSREGDYEDFSDDLNVSVYSESTTVLEEEEEGHGLLSVNGHDGRNGDITPRAPVNGPLPAVSSSASVSTVRGVPQTQGAQVVPTSAMSNGRKLVPFSPDSELWPYHHSSEGEEDEIVELDFEDTSALSDPDAFRKAKHPAGNSSEKKKLSRRERKRLKEREREEIEKSWDVPAQPTIRFDSPHASPSPEPAEPVRMANGSKKGKEKAFSRPEDVARESLIGALNGRPVQTQSKNEFIREVLTLIHTDKTFGEDLYKEYISRAGYC